MKVVIDTNVVVSAMYFGGKPQRLLHLASDKAFDTFVSEQITSEYAELAERLSKKYPDRSARFSLKSFLDRCTSVSPTRKITVCRDPDDDKFIECALEAKCIYIVSGDKDLLSIEKFEDVEIVTVAEFFARYEAVLSVGGA